VKIKLFQNMSIKNKLVLIIISASAFTIILGLLIYSIFDIINYKKEMENNAFLNATLVGKYCSAALLFDYQDEANQLLKELETIPGIINACVYDKENKIFAFYNKSNKDKISFPTLSNQQVELSSNYLHVFKSIIQQNEKIGTIYLRISTAPLTEKIIGNIIICLILLIVLGGPVFFLASRLQRIVSEPILKLADITTQVSQKKDYSIRVEVDRKDAIGVLYNRFNEMFEQIEKRQNEIDKATADLRHLNEELEERVNNRTIELGKTNQELILANKAQRDSEQRLRDILNRAPILVYINDLEGRYIFINQEFERLMKLSYEEIINKTDLELFSTERAERNITQNKKVIETRQTHIFENASKKPDGIHYFVDILFPITDSNNQIYATSGWSIDITDRKKSEEALKNAKEMAESADRLKSAFLATMSHELRTPLNSIIGFTGIILKGLAGPLTEEQSKQLNMIKGSGQHLLELINDVLDISKIEAGELVVALKPFDFSKSINKVISTIQPIANKKDLELRSNISPDINNIVSDERRVEQVFLNILNNAIKFTDRGFVEINCGIKNDQLIVRITDTGIGIKKEDLEKLFKPFSQVETGITRNHEGTGLGLSISKKLLEKLNGTISVESQFNVGSIFTVTLPINGV
jgi:PAS domain S-box-containing protein